MIIALRQKDSLREFNSENYVQIVKCAKDLLSSLYDKVVLSKVEDSTSQNQDFEKQPIQPKEYVMPVDIFVKPERPRENPNYVGKEHVRRVDDGANKNEHEPQIAFLSRFGPMQTIRSRSWRGCWRRLSSGSRRTRTRR